MLNNSNQFTGVKYWFTENITDFMLYADFTSISQQIINEIFRWAWKSTMRKSTSNFFSIFFYITITITISLAANSLTILFFFY